MNDTVAVQVTRRAPRVVGFGWSSALGAALLLIATLPQADAAEPTPLDARVVWVRGAYAYVASRDSLAIPPFSLLTFTLKSKRVATGTVERTVDGGMVVARVTSGSLAGVKRIDRLRVRVEPPTVPRVLRLGYPSDLRAKLAIAGDSTLIATTWGYVLQGEPPSLRLIRHPGRPDVERWPDTLLVRTFDNTTDQQIALERGDLDVALFLPGELAPRMREHPHWSERLPWLPEDVASPALGQIACRAELQPYLMELGPGALASLLRCIPPERRP